MMLSLKRFFSNEWAIMGGIFLIAIVVRIIPEIKAGSWVIGYDTSNTYAAELASYQGTLINWLKTANILYFFFLPFKLIGVSPEMIMKIFGPLLYGGLAIAFYQFCRKLLNFSKIQALFASVLVILQLATLRLSWDLYRNELALIFLFWGLIYLPKIKETKKFIYFLILAGLVVLSNQLVTVLMLFILVIYGLYLLIKKEWEAIVSLLVVVFATATLFLIVFNSSGQVLYNPHVFFTSDGTYFWRYFYRYDTEMSYGDLKYVIWTLFWLLYGTMIPFVVLGFITLRKNIILMIMTLWLLLGTFSALIFVGKGLIVWERWMFMLIFPFAAYGTDGLFKLGGWLGELKIWTKLAALKFGLATILLLLILTFYLVKAWPFLTADYKDAVFPLANERINPYFPRTMVHNAIGIDKSADTLAAVEWLNTHAPSGSVILVDNRYRGLMISRFDISERYIITNPWSETIQSSTLDAAKQTNYWPVYLIWNISKAVPGFDRVYNIGDRGIYKALPEFKDN